jgi:hypothetical protein
MFSWGKDKKNARGELKRCVVWFWFLFSYGYWLVFCAAI